MPVIREKRQIGSAGPVGVVRMNLGESEKYSRLADATQKLTSLGIKEMGRQARIQGEKMAQEVSDANIIALNPETGKPKALDWVGEGRFFGRAGAEAYERVVKERFQSSMENELKLKAGEIALKFKNNPYGAEQYKQQMDEYLKSMALGSEVDGKPTYYTNFIMEQGAQYIASTTLHMQEEQINRQRQVTANSIIENADARLDAVRDYAKLGKDATVLIESITESISDGENSFLLNQGAVDKYRTAAASAYAQGIIDKNFEKLGHVAANNVATAIALGDATGLTAEEKDVFDEASRFMSRTVNINGEEIQVLDYDALSSVSGYAASSAQAVENDYNADIKARRFDIALEDQRLITDIILDTASHVSMLDDSDIPLGIASQNIVGRYTNDVETLRSRALDTESSVAEFESEVQQVRQSYAKQLIASAYEAIEGDPQSVQAMINRALDDRDTSNLTGKGKAALDAVIQITTDQDNNFLDGVVSDYASSDVRSTAAYASEQALFQQELSTGYIKNISNSSSIQTANELLAEFEGRVSSFNFLSSTQQRRYVEEARNQAASVLLGSMTNKFITDENGNRRKVTSADMAAAAAYAANPDDRDGVPQELIDAVDMAKLKHGTAGYTESRLVQLTSRLSNQEAKAAARDKNKQEVAKMLSSTPTDDTPSNRELAERIVSEGIDDPEAYFRGNGVIDYSNPATQKLYAVIESGVVPKALATNLNHLATGVFVGSENEARGLMALYAHFSDQPRGNDKINAWKRTGLNDATIAKLESIKYLTLSLDVNPSDAAKQVEEARSPAMRDARIAAFNEVNGATSDVDFVLKSVPDAATNPEARKMLTALAQSLYGSIDASEMDDVLFDYYDRSFAQTEGYIKDFGSVSGFRSQFALNAVFPNQELKSYFINKVNVEVAIAMQKAGETPKMISDRNIKNRAFLMPIASSSGGVANYMLMEERSGVLSPVINPDSGIPFQFSTAEKDVVEMAEKLAVKKFNALPTVEEIKDMRAQKAKEAEMLTGTGTTGTGVSPAGSEFPGLN